MTFKTKVKSECPFCGGTFFLGDAEHFGETLHNLMIHTSPQCQKFDELEPLEFMRAVNSVLRERANDGGMSSKSQAESTYRIECGLCKNSFSVTHSHHEEIKAAMRAGRSLQCPNCKQYIMLRFDGDPPPQKRNDEPSLFNNPQEMLQKFADEDLFSDPGFLISFTSRLVQDLSFRAEVKRMIDRGLVSGENATIIREFFNK
jgi:hypothetical protein